MGEPAVQELLREGLEDAEDGRDAARKARLTNSVSAKRIALTLAREGPIRLAPLAEVCARRFCNSVPT